MFNGQLIKIDHKVLNGNLGNRMLTSQKKNILLNLVENQETTISSKLKYVLWGENLIINDRVSLESELEFNLQN